MTAGELRAFFRDEFPQSSVEIVSVDGAAVRARQRVTFDQLRPGGTVSGPVLMATADAAAYAAILAVIGPVALAVTTNLSIAFFRKPSAQRDIIADASLLKLGRRLAVADVRLFSEGAAEPVAQATITYSIPPRDRQRHEPVD